jgi:hypothetical protein
VRKEREAEDKVLKENVRETNELRKKLRRSMTDLRGIKKKVHEKIDLCLVATPWYGWPVL